MKSLIWVLLCGLLLPGVSFATAYTPLAWQRVVDGHSNPVFNGQRKNLTWVRDRNRNFIDDEIEARFRKGDRLDVILQLNHCLMPGQLEELAAGHGTVLHVGQLVTFVVMGKVLFEDLPALAARPEVAMIEWRAPDVPEMDIASRVIQARSSAVYAGQAAEDLGLTGAGINIAVVDGGVDDGSANQLSLPSSKFVAGVDVTNSALPTDGTVNPVDAYRAASASNTPHGSLVAAIALGDRLSGRQCRQGTDQPSNASSGCGGIAPGARLVDVKMCTTATCLPEPALDWIGVNAKKFNIRVVLYAYTRCGDDDGTGALAQQANFLSALGIVFVASFGNAAGSCTPVDFNGERVTKQPGSGSFVLAVAGSNTGLTITRTDDGPVASGFTGPRLDWNLMTPMLLALKPDIAAPQDLTIPLSGSTVWSGFPRSSPAAAVTAGAAALLLQQNPAMNPESVKQALIDAADNTRNTPAAGGFGQWDASIGWGLLNVGRAINNVIATQANPRFFNCNTPSVVSAGELCTLRDGNPVWSNTTDIQATTMPQVGATTTIRTHVINDGNSTATFSVNFGVYIFSAGNNQFHHIGTKQVTLSAGQDQWVDMDWTPAATNHQCIQVSIAYGADKDYTDNVTQRNFQVLPSQYTMRVENPLFVAAKMDVVQKSRRSGWQCDVVGDTSFPLDPFKDCAHDVTITFNAPKGATAGEYADCDVAVYATPIEGGGERRLVGGVTVRTFVPRICKARGQVVDVKGRPLAKAQVHIVMVPSGEPKDGGPIKPIDTTVYTDDDGVYTAQIAGDARHLFTVDKADVGHGEIMLRPGCGLEIPRLTLSKEGLNADLVKYERAPLAAANKGGAMLGCLSR